MDDLINQIDQNYRSLNEKRSLTHLAGKIKKITFMILRENNELLVGM